MFACLGYYKQTVAVSFSPSLLVSLSFSMNLCVFFYLCLPFSLSFSFCPILSLHPVPHPLPVPNVFLSGFSAAYFFLSASFYLSPISLPLPCSPCFSLCTGLSLFLSLTVHPSHKKRSPLGPSSQARHPTCDGHTCCPGPDRSVASALGLFPLTKGICN